MRLGNLVNDEDSIKRAVKLWVIWSDDPLAQNIRAYVVFSTICAVVGFGWVYGWAYISNEYVRVQPSLWWLTWLWVIGYPIAVGILLIEIPSYYSKKKFFADLDRRNAAAYAELQEFLKQSAEEDAAKAAARAAKRKMQPKRKKKSETE